MIDVATLKTYMGIVTTSDDAVLDSIISGVTAAMEGYTGKHFTETEITGERHEGTGISLMMLRFAPVISVEGVTVDDEDLEATDYEIDLDLGQLQFDDAPAAGAVVLVDYTCGYEEGSYPAELVEALCMQATWRYRQLRHNLIGMRSVAMADNAGSTVYTGLSWLVEVQAVLDMHRRFLF